MNSKLLHSLIIAVILAGFPLAVVDVSIRYFFDLRLENEEEASFAKLDRLLAEVQPWGDPEFFLKRELDCLVGQANRAGSPLGSLLDSVKRLEQCHPSLFSFTIFDEGGCVHQRERGGESRAAAEKLRTLLISPGMAWDSFAPVLSSYLGCPMFRVKKIFRQTGWLLTSKQSRKSWFYYYLGKSFSLFVHIHREGYRPAMGLFQIMERPLPKRKNLFLIDMYRRKISGASDPVEEAALFQVLARHEREPGQHFRSNGRLWSFHLLDSQFLLAACMPNSFGEKVGSFTRISRVGLAAVFLLCILGVWIFLTYKDHLFFSLFKKMVLFMLLASGVPLTILIIFGVIFLQEREKAFLQQAARRGTDTIRDFERKVPLAARQVENELRKTIQTADLETDEGRARLGREMKRLKQQFRCRNIRTMDPSGTERDEAWSVVSGGGASERLRRGTQLAILRYHNPAFWEAGENKDFSQTDAVVNTLLGAKEGDFISLAIDELGKLSSQELGGDKLFLYMNLIRNRLSEATHVFSMTWGFSDFITYFLHRNLPVNYLEDRSELVAIDGEGSWRRSKRVSRRMVRVFLSLPAKPVSPDLNRFFQRLLRVRQPLSQTIRYKDAPYMAVGMPGQTLKNFLLISLQPLSPIFKEVGMIRTRITVFAFFSLAFAFILGLFLSKKVLVPIQDLSRGIQAVHEKRFSFQISRHDRDELGELAVLFNSMMGSLLEMSMGKEVQERLFPQAPISLGEYGVHGRSLPAGDLGGDYFDYHVVDDRFLFVLIGDVTGHGVPAAMVMAMAKAAVLNGIHAKQGIEGILDSLNAVIFLSMQRKLLMTAGVFWINTVSHEIRFFNFAHPFPLKQNAAGEWGMLAGRGTPLGFRLSSTLSPVQIALVPGERIFLYTDGLVESLPADEEVSNYDHFENYLASRPYQSIDQVCNDVLKNHPFFQSDQPQPDDFTLMVIERVRK